MPGVGPRTMAAVFSWSVATSRVTSLTGRRVNLNSLVLAAPPMGPLGTSTRSILLGAPPVIVIPMVIFTRLDVVPMPMDSMTSVSPLRRKAMASRSRLRAASVVMLVPVMVLLLSVPEAMRAIM